MVKLGPFSVFIFLILSYTCENTLYVTLRKLEYDWKIWGMSVMILEAFKGSVWSVDNCLLGMQEWALENKRNSRSTDQGGSRGGRIRRGYASLWIQFRERYKRICFNFKLGVGYEKRRNQKKDVSVFSCERMLIFWKGKHDKKQIWSRKLIQTLVSHIINWKWLYSNEDIEWICGYTNWELGKKIGFRDENRNL